ncbi:YitT family protein [Streptococcus uberis]|uniref:Membrane protein n=1 Tax=Streptococcus uberis (strain ATCC BAA-854 / 0140J) TaxID=218495 RepID=B9DW77_STRU0|nr:YitT family protein [Streptococcus uberis]KKF40475.1 membrane protein [Streptococcus uberis Ab71]KKF40919.1 membrane protein [Streptococcus uberis C9359]KKF46175.1 membrane protein [Streptococcus uberis C5072]KKF47383.1 membrane protein [Streptococcus uberis C8329]KKF51774.1 membrane protein [Streptococcus uberis C5388]
MKVNEWLEKLRKLLLITIGVAIYAFGFVNFNMANKLAEGGVAGITLMIHALLGINPAYTTLLLNVPLFILGARIFGRKSLALTIYGTVSMSFFIWLWQKSPIEMGLENDMMLVSVVAGLFSGVGSGLVFRYGATTGGTDIIGRIAEEKFGIKLGQTLLFVDAIILTASLTYIDLKHMLYTLVASFVFSQVLTIVQNGGYTIRGMIIITKHSKAAAQAIQTEINRGVTYLKGEGAYSGNEYNVIYVTLSPNEVREVKRILAELDPDAFISIVDVDEVVSSDFKIRRKNYDKPV